jgi:hypothetical protein
LSIPTISRLIKFRTRMPVGTTVVHKRFGVGVTTTELTGDGYTWVRFVRGYRTLSKRALREIHYTRLEKVDDLHPSN